MSHGYLTDRPQTASCIDPQRTLVWLKPRWLTTDMARLKDLAGGPVLVDFWTYSCVNCIRTLPYVKAWHTRYAPFGLVVVGVHTPEFDFEKEPANVEAALKEFGITYPVVLDSDYQIWSLYANQYWPRKFLLNKDGQIVYDHAGEGGYRETELAIQGALLEVNPALNLPPVTKDEGEGGICYPTTPETYLGSLRGRAGSVWNFRGDWKVRPEYIEHTRTTDTFEDYLRLRFRASEVNLVMGMEGGRRTTVKLELNGKFLKEVEVRQAKMYNLVGENKFLEGELKVFVLREGLRAYAFTFGGCFTNAEKK